MAKREWKNIDCLTYLFNAFAVYTDADLDEDEKRVIANETIKYVSDADDAYESLNKTLGWFQSDLGKDLDEKTFGTKESIVLKEFFGLSFYVKDSSRLGCQIQITPELDGLVFELAQE